MKDWRKIMKANCVRLLLALVLSVFGAASQVFTPPQKKET